MANYANIRLENRLYDPAAVNLAGVSIKTVGVIFWTCLLELLLWCSVVYCVIPEP